MRFALVVMLISSTAFADDLASPVQTKRDAAAKQLITSYKPTPKAKLEPVIAGLKPKSTPQQVLAAFSAYKPTPEGGAASGYMETIQYRLDPQWMAECTFKVKTRGRLDKDKQLVKCELVESVAHVWVEPPKDFTGVWTVYFANGQKSHEIHYKNGKYDGDFTSFHDDGSKAVVQHYTARGIDGEEVGYFKSGKVSYRGTYRNGVRTGEWTHYDETGKVTSVEKL
jgi:hypothetical protein